MKPLSLIPAPLLLMIFMIAFFSLAHADQRCDMDTGNCHVSLDPNDDDTEIDFPAARMTSAGVSRTVVNGTRTASGWYVGYLYIPLDTVEAHDFLQEGVNVYRKGADSNATNLPYEVAANTTCNLVRSNFQENTGSDDQNQTEYVTNDWRVVMTWVNKMGGKFGQYGIWHTAMYCQNATQQ